MFVEKIVFIKLLLIQSWDWSNDKKFRVTLQTDYF